MFIVPIYVGPLAHCQIMFPNLCLSLEVVDEDGNPIIPPPPEADPPKDEETFMDNPLSYIGIGYFVMTSICEHFLLFKYRLYNRITTY